MAERAFDKIMQGLKEMDAYQKGKLKARKRTLKIEPTRAYDAKKVKNLRKELLNLTQAAFAGVCGVSNKTVEAWESGKNMPSGSACRLFELIENDPEALERSGILSIS
jgi:putative transcriptional regulator